MGRTTAGSQNLSYESWVLSPNKYGCDFHAVKSSWKYRISLNSAEFWRKEKCTLTTPVRTVWNCTIWGPTVWLYVCILWSNKCESNFFCNKTLNSRSAPFSSIYDFFSYHTTKSVAQLPDELSHKKATDWLVRNKMTKKKNVHRILV